MLNEKYCSAYILILTFAHPNCQLTIFMGCSSTKGTKSASSFVTPQYVLFFSHLQFPIPPNYSLLPSTLIPLCLPNTHLSNSTPDLIWDRLWYCGSHWEDYQFSKSISKPKVALVTGCSTTLISWRQPPPWSELTRVNGHRNHSMCIAEYQNRELWYGRRAIFHFWSWSIEVEDSEVGTVNALDDGCNYQSNWR